MKNKPHDLSTQKGRNEYVEAMSAPPKKVSALSRRAEAEIVKISKNTNKI